MIVFNETKFENIIKYYNLENYLNYFKLFNKSKYINSYHGYEHVKRFIYSLFLTLYNERSYDELRTLMVAAIFHDFGYLGSFSDSIEESFDIKNIEVALEAVSDAHYNKRLHFDVDLNTVKNLIIASEYPKCNYIELSGNSKHFVDCDHSMLLYTTYPFMGLMFFYNELGMRSCEDNFEEKVNSYFDSVKFHNQIFSNMYNKNKEKIVNTYIDFIKSHIKSYGYDILNDNILADYYKFERVNESKGFLYE